MSKRKSTGDAEQSSKRKKIDVEAVKGALTKRLKNGRMRSWDEYLFLEDRYNQIESKLTEPAKEGLSNHFAMHEEMATSWFGPRPRWETETDALDIITPQAKERKSETLKQNFLSNPTHGWHAPLSTGYIVAPGNEIMGMYPTPIGYHAGSIKPMLEHAKRDDYWIDEYLGVMGRYESPKKGHGLDEALFF